MMLIIFTIISTAAAAARAAAGGAAGAAAGGAAASSSGDGTSSEFSFSSFSTSSDLLLLGDAFVSNGSIELTSDAETGLSAGRALFPHPVKFISSNATVSFSTSFTFSIANQSPVHYGDGLAFIVVPNNATVGGPGGWLGFLNSSTTYPASSTSSLKLGLDDRAHSFAVEFDTFLNVDFGDPNDNHVGVDVNSIRSVAFADAGSASIQLKSGSPITAWIEYDSSRQELEVSMSYDGRIKPQKRLLSVSIALWDILDEFMYVGFSGATGGDVELHSVHSWSFSTNLPDVEDGASSPGTPAATASAPAAAPVAAPVHLLRGCKVKLCVAGSAGFFGISAAAAVVGASLIVCCIWLVYGRLRHRKLKRTHSFRCTSMVSGPRKFSYKELTAATKGFNASKVVGHGAFGVVYKGQLMIDGVEVQVAVKRAEGSKKGSKEEFLSELSIIGCLRHRNLVQLQGWCRERDELLLVYDFMPNGSLDKLLFGSGKDIVLTWPMRYKVVTGVASALAYLHSEWEQQVVHRDVKASNIMLDAAYNARLGDFGLAKLIEHDQSPETTITAGTLGYLAPEYLHTGKATDKTDVYSFGTVALEVATGRRPIEKDEDEDRRAEPPVLVDRIWLLQRDQKLIEAADPKLCGEFDEREMMVLLTVGLHCCHPDPAARPSMAQAVQFLMGVTPVPPLPRFKPRPSFATLPPLSIHDIITTSP